MHTTRAAGVLGLRRVPGGPLEAKKVYIYMREYTLEKPRDQVVIPVAENIVFAIHA